MNKKGQLGVAIITAIFIFIIGMMAINLLKPEITAARTNLNCSNTASLTDATKLLCLIIDSTIPYWILLIFSVVIGGITARLAIR